MRFTAGSAPSWPVLRHFAWQEPFLAFVCHALPTTITPNGWERARTSGRTPIARSTIARSAAFVSSSRWRVVRASMPAASIVDELAAALSVLEPASAWKGDLSTRLLRVFARNIAAAAPFGSAHSGDIGESGASLSSSPSISALWGWRWHPISRRPIDRRRAGCSTPYRYDGCVLVI